MQKKTEQMIEVLYTLSDAKGTYSKFIGTSICSLLENTQAPVRLHLFHDGTLSAENRAKFIQLVEHYGQQIEFLDVRKRVPELCRRAEQIFAEAMQAEARYPEAAMYRLMAPQLLPKSVHRLIYLDADIIVNLDIKELWQEKLGSNGMGAVREPTLLKHYGRYDKNGVSQEKAYDRMKENGVTLETCFNSGVLLMNLDCLRKLGDILIPGLQFLAQYPGESKFYDQNILNLYFARDLTPLKWHYNILLHWDRQYAPATVHKGIYHYMGHTLNMDCEDPRDVLFYEYLLKTPWCDGRFLCYMAGVQATIFKTTFGPWMMQNQDFARMSLRRQPVLAICRERLPEILRIFREPLCIHQPLSPGEKLADIAPAEAMDYFRLQGIRYVDLGWENEQLSLNLTYDVEQYCYLCYVLDYPKLAAILGESGLQEKEHFMDGHFLWLGKPWLDHIVESNRFFAVL